MISIIMISPSDNKMPIEPKGTKRRLRDKLYVCLEYKLFYFEENPVEISM